MSIIIEKINENHVNRIFTKDDLRKIATADQYLKNVVTKADELLRETKTQCEDAKLKAMQQVMQENAQLLDQFNLKLEDFLKKINNNMCNTVHKVLQKLGVENVSASQIYNLIHNELQQSSMVKRVSITLNPKILESVKLECSQRRGNLSIDWRIDSKLSINACICETDLWVLKIDLTKLIEIISNLNRFTT